MENKKDEQIYQAKDRGFPLNEMQQDLVDKWLNNEPFADKLLSFELFAIRNQIDKKCDKESEQ